MRKVTTFLSAILGAFVLILGLEQWLSIYLLRKPWETQLSAVQVSQLANVATMCFLFIALIVLLGISEKLSQIHKGQQIQTEEIIRVLHSANQTQSRNEQHLIELVKRTPNNQFVRSQE